MRAVRAQGIGGSATAWHSMGCADIVALTLPGDPLQAVHPMPVKPSQPSAGRHSLRAFLEGSAEGPRFPFPASWKIWGHPRVTTSEPSPVGLRDSKISESILQWAGSVFDNFPGSQFILIPLARATRPVRRLGAAGRLPTTTPPLAPLVGSLRMSSDVHNMLYDSVLH